MGAGRRRASRKPSFSIVSNASPRKASTSMARASGSGNAAGAQEEQGVGVEFARRRAVAALHVVGVDFEFRLGDDFRLVRQQQRAAQLAWRRFFARPARPGRSPDRRRARPRRARRGKSAWTRCWARRAPSPWCCRNGACRRPDRRRRFRRGPSSPAIFSSASWRAKWPPCEK